MTTIKEKAPLRPVECIPDMCLACGTCSAGCPITGTSGFDPRKIVRMVLIRKNQGDVAICSLNPLAFPTWLYIFALRFWTVAWP